jgi:hypothetical protein
MASYSEAQITAPRARSSFLLGRNTAWVLVGALLLAGVVGFVTGSQGSDVMELEGRAHVGNHMASIESGGWFYGLSESVAWIDASGSQHEDGWPGVWGEQGTPPTSGSVPLKFRHSDSAPSYTSTAALHEFNRPRHGSQIAPSSMSSESVIRVRLDPSAATT